jgi:hypothetical protein
VDVFPYTVAQSKIQGFPASPPPKSTFSADGKRPENPCIQAVFQVLICFLHLSSIPHTQHALSGEKPLKENT